MPILVCSIYQGTCKYFIFVKGYIAHRKRENIDCSICGISLFEHCIVDK